MLREILMLVFAYLLGSVSPAYFLAKIIKGVDIRNHGTKNAGTTNVKRLLGLGPATLTAIFDIGKGLLAVWIGLVFGLPPVAAYLVGLLAVLGHIFPFYLKFRGGQGMATATGLLFFFLIKLIFSGSIGWMTFWPGLLTLIIVVLSVLFIMRDSRALGIIALPAFMFFLLTNSKPVAELYFLSAILVFMIGINILVIFQQQVFAKLKLKDSKAEHLLNWRTFARPLAVVLVVILFYWPKTTVLYIVGGLAAVFIVVDLVRLISRQANRKLFSWKGFLKEKDRRRFSSMTMFLTAVFLIDLLFPASVAGLATTFLIFGDLAAKFFGIFYSKIFFWDKSVEGTLAHFAFSLLFGAIFAQFVPLPYYLIVVGAATASTVDAFSLFGIDDNFTVGLISAAVIQSILVFV